MNKPNTDYGIRIPSHDELRFAFGSLAACVRITGGDLHTILFYLNNQDRIADAPECAPQSGEYAEELREADLAERASSVLHAMDKPTVKGVAAQLGVCREVARRALVRGGARSADGKWRSAQ